MFSEKLRLTTSSRHEECTQRSRRLHYDHGKKLKQQLRQHGMYLFPSCHARHITTGVGTSRKFDHRFNLRRYY